MCSVQCAVCSVHARTWRRVPCPSLPFPFASAWPHPRSFTPLRSTPFHSTPLHSTPGPITWTCTLSLVVRRMNAGRTGVRRAVHRDQRSGSVRGRRGVYRDVAVERRRRRRRRRSKAFASFRVVCHYDYTRGPRGVERSGAESRVEGRRTNACIGR